MASRRWSIRFVAIAILTSACTSGSQPTQPSAPPDVFAPTPTIGDLAEPTTTRRAPPTTVDLDRTEVYPVDPLTLEPLPGYQPIPMGDWTWGISSPDGRWLALTYGDETNGTEGLRLVDIPNWSLVGEWPRVGVNPVGVDDDGAIYGVSWSAPDPELVRVGPGMDAPELVTQVSFDFYPWVPSISRGRLVLLGPAYDESSPGASEVWVHSVDLSAGASFETVLANITVGATAIVELEDGQIGIHDVFPGVVSDREGAVLVVHATEDVVTRFDPANGEVSRHRFGPLTEESTGAAVTHDQVNNVAYWASTRRTAALAPGGGVLYISGTVGRLHDAEGEVIVENSPSGIVSVDTNTWEIIDRLDVPVSDLYSSPDGRHLIGVGSLEQTAPSYRYESSGVYLIDPTGLEVRVHHFPTRPDQFFGSVSFSPDSAVAHVTSYPAGVDQVDVIDLISGEFVATRENISVFGNGAVVAKSTVD